MSCSKFAQEGLLDREDGAFQTSLISTGNNAFGRCIFIMFYIFSFDMHFYKIFGGQIASA